MVIAESAMASPCLRFAFVIESGQFGLLEFLAVGDDDLQFIFDTLFQWDTTLISVRGLDVNSFVLV